MLFRSQMTVPKRRSSLELPCASALATMTNTSTGAMPFLQYLAAIRSLERQFKGFTLQHVDRAKNEEADALAKAAARGESLPSDVFYHVIGTPAVRSPEGLQITNDSEGHRIVNLIMTEDWRAPITLFLQGYYHPADVSEAKRLRHRSRDFGRRSRKRICSGCRGNQETCKIGRAHV